MWVVLIEIAEMFPKCPISLVDTLYASGSYEGQWKEHMQQKHIHMDMSQLRMNLTPLFWSFNAKINK